MLNVIYEFIPIILFFVAFKFYGIFAATAVGIVVTAFQVLITMAWKKKLEKQQMITLVVFLVFGGMTLYFHNPLFVKWKPTVIYWIFAILLLGSHFVGDKPLLQRLMKSINDSQMQIPKMVWAKINIAWTVFFTLLGFLNLYVAYHFSTNTWVNFKLYGTLGLLLVFSFAQALYLARYMTETK